MTNNTRDRIRAKLVRRIHWLNLPFHYQTQDNLVDLIMEEIKDRDLFYAINNGAE